MTPFTLRLQSGKAMYGWQWVPESPRCVVVLVTGMMETASRYDQFAQYLNHFGCAVYCLDHYGQGENCPTLDDLGIWPANGFELSLEMIRQEVAAVRREGLPLYLFAHSMGSYMLQAYLTRWGSTLDRVVLCGSCGPRSVILLGAALARLRARQYGRDLHRDNLFNTLMFGSANKRISNRKTDYDWLSSDPDAVAAYLADPRCGWIGTNGFYADVLTGFAALGKPADQRRIPSDLPIFLIAGTDDPTGEYGEGVKRLKALYDRAGCNVRMKLYPGMRHELLNERGRDEVYTDVAQFFGLEEG